MKQNRIQVYQDKAGEWRWRIRTKNGRIVADSAEGYKTRFNILRAAINFLKITGEGLVLDGG